MDKGNIFNYCLFPVKGTLLLTMTKMIFLAKGITLNLEAKNR